MSADPESWPLKPLIPHRKPGAIVARAGLLALHHRIERDLQEVARRLPTVVLPTGIDVWPMPWDFRQSRRLIHTASQTCGRFLDNLDVDGPGLYRTVPPVAAPSDEGRLTRTWDGTEAV